MLRIGDPSYDITANKHGGNRESFEANEKIATSKLPTRKQIMWYAAEWDIKGITADGTAAYFGCFHGHVSPRISELKAMGLLVPTTRRRKTRSGCWARVLVTRAVAIREGWLVVD